MGMSSAPHVRHETFLCGGGLGGKSPLNRLEVFLGAVPLVSDGFVELTSVFGFVIVALRLILGRSGFSIEEVL